jgi:hypothetical protein
MKTVGRYTFSSLALALLSCFMWARPADAQGYIGKFTLPFEAHWGKATLPAGNYSFSLDRAEAILHLVHGRQTVALILAETVTDEPSNASSLVVVPSGGIRSVRELRLSLSGLVLRYGPANAKHKQTFEEDRTSSLIPVDAAGAEQ